MGALDSIGGAAGGMGSSGGVSSSPSSAASLDTRIDTGSTFGGAAGGVHGVQFGGELFPGAGLTPFGSINSPPAGTSMVLSTFSNPLIIFAIFAALLMFFIFRR